MHKNLKLAFFLFLIGSLVTIGLIYFFSAQIAVLSPAGMIGEKQRSLLMISVYVMLLVVVPVFILTFFIAWKYRASNQKAKYSPEWDQNHTAEIIWWGIPLIIIVVLGILTWKGCHDLDPFKPIASDRKPLKIQVVALQWKWLFIYPEQNIATVNFFEFPKETPVEFEVTADAPMNSFWIPRLGGQVYAMAGMRSKLSLIANGEGSYYGSSANISGEGFAGMKFTAQSTTQEGFDQWVSSIQQSSSVLTLDAYNELVEPSSYVPRQFFKLGSPGLFDDIIMKYMMPMKGMHSRGNRS